MELTFAAATDVGRQRNHNEDNFLVDKKLQLFIVADGMGGHAAGEVASSITVHQLRDAVYANRDLLERFSTGDDSVQGVEILQMLEHAAQAACGAVYDRAQEESDKRGMGTTVSVLLIVNGPQNPRGFIAHVGDSRIYLTRQGQTHQLTEDHSLMNELIKRGKIKPGEIDSSPYKQFKNAVTRAIGVYPSVEVDTFDFDIFPGDQFLLCSDGVYVYLNEDELPDLLGRGEVRDVPKDLVRRANEGGGHDNITIIVVRIGAESTETVESRAAEMTLKLEVLKGMPLFRYLSYKELVRVMNVTDTVSFDAGEPLFEEGAVGETMYVVLEGQVRLHKDGQTVALLGRGQHLGEMALVDRSPRSLCATAIAPSRFVAIRRRDFYEIIKKEPSLSVKLLWSFVQVLAERLRKTTSDLTASPTAEPARTRTARRSSGGPIAPPPMRERYGAGRIRPDSSSGDLSDAGRSDSADDRDDEDEDADLAATLPVSRVPLGPTTGGIPTLDLRPQTPLPTPAGRVDVTQDTLDFTTSGSRSTGRDTVPHLDLVDLEIDDSAVEIDDGDEMSLDAEPLELSDDDELGDTVAEMPAEADALPPRRRVSDTIMDGGDERGEDSPAEAGKE